MVRPASHFGRCAALLWAGAERVAGVIDTAFAHMVVELRRLNSVGADASSRNDRVRRVKETLARRGKGPNRCC
jgi:hypothetical protein